MAKKFYTDIDHDSTTRSVNVPTPVSAGDGPNKAYVDPPVDTTSALVGTDVKDVWKRLYWPTTSRLPVFAANGTITSVTFFQGSTQNTINRMAQVTLTYDANLDPATETTVLYSLTDGTTVLKTITKTFTFTAGVLANVTQVVT